MKSLDKQFIFIIGAPRSGTSWVHRMLAEHPQVAAIDHELTVFSRYLAPWARHFAAETQSMNEGKWSQGMPTLFSAEEFEQRMRAFVDDVYTRVQERRPAATHILDK